MDQALENNQRQLEPHALPWAANGARSALA